jgi:hypothetical protein
MSNGAEQKAFEEFVTGPMIKSVGTALRSVEYYALDCDLPDFDASDLTASGGCQGVHLTFDGGEFEVDWGIVPDLRDPNGYFAYHLMVRPLLKGQVSEILHGRTPVNATEALPWKSVIGETLLTVSVQGIVLEEHRPFPQAVEFTFPSGRIYVIVGWTGTILSLGDGDEVLVFSAEEWEALKPENFFMAGQKPVLLWQIRSEKRKAIAPVVFNVTA